MGQGMNRVTLLGNLGADPELRYTKEGLAVLDMRVATSESWLDKSGQKQEKTEWHDVTVWGARGEALAKLLHKGELVLVEGRLQTTSYDKDGVRRWRTRVVAMDICLTGSKRAAHASSPPERDEAPPIGPSQPPPARNGAPRIAAQMHDEIPF